MTGPSLHTLAAQEIIVLHSKGALLVCPLSWESQRERRLVRFQWRLLPKPFFSVLVVIEKRPQRRVRTRQRHHVDWRSRDNTEPQCAIQTEWRTHSNSQKIFEFRKVPPKNSQSDLTNPQDKVVRCLLGRRDPRRRCCCRWHCRPNGERTSSVTSQTRHEAHRYRLSESRLKEPRHGVKALATVLQRHHALEAEPRGMIQK